VWSSNREAYAGELSVEEQRRLEADPAYFADLYRMRADGSQVEQISRAPGYDGGPFYFADGSRVVWRRFDEAGLLADLYTALPDGSDVRRITEFGSMSWAPYPHPSGRYLVFASNKLGFENFELFLVDAEGRKQPVQVTHSPGFDGLPVFSPDGKRLSFTSSRHGGSQGQIYLADWSHEGALEALEAAPTRASAAP
jgi:Tol biopolymer transport system component